MLTPSEISISVISGDHRRYPSTWGGLGYNDPFARLYYVNGGQGAIRHHDVTFRLQKGGIYLIPSHTLSDYRCHPFLDLYWIHFTARVFGAISLFSLMEPAFELSVREIPLARELFERLVGGLKNADAALQLEMDGIVRLFLGRLYSGHTEIVDAAGHEGLARIRPVLAYVDAHLDRAITLDEIAGVMHLHPNYCSNLFKKIMRVPPLTYVVRRRIEKAQHQLWLTNDAVKTISWNVGYDDELYFSRAFKKVVGVSPARYREQRRMGARE